MRNGSYCDLYTVESGKYNNKTYMPPKASKKAELGKSPEPKKTEKK